MRKFLSLSFLVFLNLLSLKFNGQRLVQFDKSFHDFGYVKFGDPTKCTFSFTNNGSTTIVPTQCQTSCGCDVASCSKYPVAPGESGQLEYLYDHSRMGIIHKTATIRFAGIDSVFCLQVCGYIYDPENYLPDSQKPSYSCGCNAVKPDLVPIILNLETNATQVVHGIKATVETPNFSSSVFPNPLSSQSVIKFSESLEGISITMHNSAGVLVKEQVRLSGRVFPINREDLASGIYYIQVMQNDKIIATHRVVINSE